MDTETINIEDLSRGSIIEYQGKWEKVQDIVGNCVTFQNATYKEVPIGNCMPIVLTSKIVMAEPSFCKATRRFYIGDYFLFNDKEKGFYTDKPREVYLQYVHIWQRYHRLVTGKELEIVMPVI